MKAKKQEKFPELSPDQVRLAHRALQARGMIYYGEEGVLIPVGRKWEPLFGERKMEEEIVAWGSSKLLLTHDKEIKLTKLEKVDEATLGIKATKASADLKEEFKALLKTGRLVEVVIEVGELRQQFFAFGSPALKLLSTNELSLRKDDQISDSTVAILSEKSAHELDKELVQELKKENTKFRLLLRV